MRLPLLCVPCAPFGPVFITSMLALLPAIGCASSSRTPAEDDGVAGHSGSPSSGGQSGSRGQGGNAGAAAGGMVGTGGVGEGQVDPRIRVDHFGYLPDEEKVAVIGVAQEGFNAPEMLQPGDKLEVRRWPDGTVVFAGAPAVWNGGAADALAGDKGWWFDFSEVRDSGTYVVFDVKRGVRSEVFRVGPDVYADVMVQALRTFYYQREGFEKKPPHADPRWADGASHVNDKKARSIIDMANAASERDVSGGWMDAGDQNKYVTFLDNVIAELLYAYQKHPKVFTDATNIPESGNGVPDVLDEIQWEVEFLLRMQDSDGGVFIKAGATDTSDPSPPSADMRPRFYGRKCTSAAISFSAIVAQVAVIYGSVPALATKGPALTTAATKAWDWWKAQPALQSDCDNGEIKSGDADRTVAEQEAGAVRGAYWLWKLTKQAKYHDHFKSNLNKLSSLRENWWGPYNIVNEDAVFMYLAEPEADGATKAAIVASLDKQEVNAADYYGFDQNKALYRAFLPKEAFHWGSNMVRTRAGSILLRVLDFDVKLPKRTQYRTRALSHLHWMHGVNALGKVYLSNMAAFGGERSVDTFYHSWFADKTPWDDVRTSAKGPAPGFVVGGPNSTYGVESWYDPATKDEKPPFGQPPEKSYKDFNEVWPQASWSVTENGIYYQAAYIRLLASLMDKP